MHSFAQRLHSYLGRRVKAHFRVAWQVNEWLNRTKLFGDDAEAIIKSGDVLIGLHVQGVATGCKKKI